MRDLFAVANLLEITVISLRERVTGLCKIYLFIYFIRQMAANSKIYNQHNTTRAGLPYVNEAF